MAFIKAIRPVKPAQFGHRRYADRVGIGGDVDNIGWTAAARRRISVTSVLIVRAEE